MNLLEVLCHDIGYISIYVFFLGKGHSLCHIFNGRSVARTTLKASWFKACIPNGGDSAPQGVKSWFWGGGILDIIMVCPSKGP